MTRYIAAYDTSVSTGSWGYHEFSMSANTWSVTNELIDGLTNNPTSPLAWISIAVRSDGDVVVVYTGGTDQVMGGTKERVDYNVRTFGGSWGGPQALANAAADEHYGNPNCVLGTNDIVHCVWQRTQNIADPPTAWTLAQAAAIDPADDSLSSLAASVSQDTAGDLLGYPNLVTYDDGGTQRIIVSGWNDATTLHTVSYTENAGDQSITRDQQLAETFTAEKYANGEVGV